jgi:hypothetical protein
MLKPRTRIWIRASSKTVKPRDVAKFAGAVPNVQQVVNEPQVKRQKANSSK